MGWQIADLPLPPPKSTPKHGDIYLDPDTMDVAMYYDGIIERWFKMTQEQYHQYKGKLKLPPTQHAVSGVISVPKSKPIHCPICGNWNCYTCKSVLKGEATLIFDCSSGKEPKPPQEKPITDFGLEDDLFQI